MDYEKKYKEALERARVFHTGGGTIDAHITETIFPELKESEDERIRKWCISHINACINVIKDNDEYKEYLSNKVIAWLEKQGDKKPTENIKTKFCEGDKVVSKQDGKVYTVGTAYWVNGDNICLQGTDGHHKWTNEDDLNKNYHLWIEAKKLDADKVIAWLVANILDYEYFVEWFKKDFKL